MDNYFVTMTDNTISHGTYIDKLVFICDTYLDVNIVTTNAKKLEGISDIKVFTYRPNYYRSTRGSDYICGRYRVQIKSQHFHNNWYQPNA